MTHPITPPPELVREWNQEATGTHFEPYGYSEFIATRAAQWGSDQELEACCEYIEQWVPSIDGLDPSKCLRAARRPKPPSLKEQAFEAQQRLMTGAWRAEDWQLIDRALEALPE
jgi:hypothetical protein